MDSIKPVPSKIVFDHVGFINEFTGALNQIDTAVQLGEAAAAKGIDRLFFIGCGAPHFMMRVLVYWSRRFCRKLDIRLDFSAEFIHQDSLAVDERSLVILGSHSGKTKETVKVARFLHGKSCRTIAITQEANSLLGMNVDEVISYGKSKEGYFSSYIITQLLVSSILNQLEPGWPFHSDLLVALPNLPAALANAKLTNLENAAKQAREFAGDDVLYVIGAGPMYTTAYTFASCFLMEMQRMHAHPLVAAEFFHGPFEIVDKSTPIILLIGEDAHRPEAERVSRFCREYAEHFIQYDSKDFAMKGISAAIRPLIAPFILDAALTALVEQFALIRNHPLTTRRYMGKVEY